LLAGVSFCPAQPEKNKQATINNRAVTAAQNQVKVLRTGPAGFCRGFSRSLFATK
jgi:hypothetical protein